MAQLQFDARSVEPSEEFKPVPEAWYPASIVESEIKPNSANTGSYLSLTFKLLEGQYINRQIFTLLNINNANAVAQNIAHQNLSAICHAINVLQMNDTQELHDQPMMIKVKISKGGPRKDRPGENYDDKNDIKNFKAIETTTTSTAAFVPNQPAQQETQVQASPVQQATPVQANTPQQTPAATTQPPASSTGKPPWVK